MSSHHEWAEEQMRVHDATRPYAPENGQPLRFSKGDSVTYTNPAGIEFNLTVTGHYERPAQACGRYANGARYYLDWETPWYAVEEKDLRLNNADLDQAVALEMAGSW